MSKHQQVQLLEVRYSHSFTFTSPPAHLVVSQAAAILSHLAPSARGGTSLPEDRGLWPAYLSGGTLRPTTSAMTTPINATLIAEKPSPVISSSLPNSSELNRSYSLPRVHELAVTSTNVTKHLRPGAFNICGNDPGDSSISRTTSSPIDLRSAKNVGGISSRSNSEGGGHAWHPHSCSVISRSSYSPPTDDDSDFEMNEQPALDLSFDHSGGTREESGGKGSEWDGLEMEMEM